MKSLFLAAAFVLAIGSASAHEYKAGSIEIKHPWARATPKGSEVAGGYMKLINTRGEPHRPIGGATAAAREIENHDKTLCGGVLKADVCPPRLASQTSPTGA